MEVKIDKDIKHKFGIFEPEIKELREIIEKVKVKNGEIIFKEPCQADIFIKNNTFFKKNLKIGTIRIDTMIGGFVHVDVTDCKYFLEIKEAFEMIEDKLEKWNKNCDMSINVNAYNAKNTECLKGYLLGEEL